MTKSRFVLVSGGSGGIGAALCHELSSNGYTPIVAYNNNREAAESVAKNCSAPILHLNLCDEVSINVAIESLHGILGDDGELEGLILGASPPPDLLPFGKLTSEILNKQLQVNVIGPQVLLSALIKIFFKKKKSGFVLGILSEAIGTHDKAPATGMGAYVIAKAGLNNLLTVCAAEHPWLKVRTISPSFTKTKMLDVFDERYLEILQRDRDFSEPETIAKQILSEIER